MQIGERMFLIIGSGHLAVRLSQWCALRRRSVLIGLASNLPLDGPLEGCEIIALPSPMPLNSLPLEAQKPTAVLLLNPEALADENPLEAIQNHWQDVPILTTLSLEGDGVDLISVDDVSFAAMQDRIRSWEQKDGASVLHHYLHSVPEGSKVAIFCHDNPDPDALGAGLAMHELVQSMGLEPMLLHGGLIEHQQNRAMVRLLDIPVRRLILDWEVQDVLRDAAVVITVDFHRPGANNVLPEDCVPHIVLDHHTSDESVAADISMLRPEYSATSSLVASLLMSLNYPMTARVATALAFGIRTDTLGFTRHFNPVDIRALSWLNAYVDSELIRSIEEPPRSQDTLESFAEALSSRTLVGSTLLAPLSSMPNRDSLAQIADFLLPTEGIDTVVVFGPRRGKVILSARSKDEGIHLGRLLSDTWGGGLSGGHKALAGGQIPFEFLLNQLPENPEEADVQAVDAMSFRLRELFAGGADE
jgi:nanoRNase/pAp phosphatase (c-di-AMP/oligoRNAs hydrolase)